MIRKGLIVSFSLILTLFFFLNSSEDFYKSSKVIKLVNHSGFTELPWNSTYLSMAVAPDGSIFIVNQDQHSVLAIGPKGNIERKFGKQGQGEGDIYLPSSISILDGKYLVIGDFPRNKKISIFKLDGYLYRVIRTNEEPYYVVALKDNKIAYLTIKRNVAGDEVGKKLVTIFLKSIETMEEKEIITYFIRDPSIVRINGQIRIFMNAFFTGDIFIERNKDGDLLVGLSTIPEIDIYSAVDWKRTGKIPLKLDRVKVTDEFEKAFKNSQIEKLKVKDYWKKHEQEIKKEILSRNFFNDFLPYFRYIMTDSQGNILVFKERSSYNDESVMVQVYSPTGKYSCEMKIETGKEFKLDVESLRWYRKLQITDKVIYALAESRETGETHLLINKLK